MSDDQLIEETRDLWREVGQTLVRESVASLDEAAKQLIAVTGILEGLYFHAITFGDLRGQVSGGQWLIYLAPVVLLLVSLNAALLV